VLASLPAILWQRDSARWRSNEEATRALLARERASADSFRDQLQKLRANAAVRAVPIFALELERGADAAHEPPKQLTVPAGAAAIVLALPSDLVRQASSAEIRNAAGQIVRTVSPLAASDADSSGLTVESQLLPAGRYTVVMLAGERTLARFPFEIRVR
jgi:hypothetical protein